MTIRNRSFSNREPSQSYKGLYRLTARPCPTCGLTIYSREGTTQPCGVCELLAMTQAQEQPDPRIARRESILAAFRDEPINKTEAAELLTELAEIDQALQFHPSDSLSAYIGANWNRMDEISF